jgi:DNA-binding NarL/FixJ family response regulator
MYTATLTVLNGPDAAQKITQAKPAAKVIMVTSHANLPYVEEAFRRGARGYELKGRIADLSRRSAEG